MKVSGKACMKYLKRSCGSRRDRDAEQQLEAWLVSYFAGDWWRRYVAVVKFVDEIGLSKASSRLGIPVELLYDWVERVKFSNQPTQTEKNARALAKKGLAHAKDFGWLDRTIPQRKRYRFEKDLREFLLSPEFLSKFCGGDEKLARQTLAKIKGRGLGSWFELLGIADVFRAHLGMKRRRSARKNLKKANKAKRAKAEEKRQLEKQRKREEKRQEQERIKRAMEKLNKPPASGRSYI
jgi:hypothetical protein